MRLDSSMEVENTILEEANETSNNLEERLIHIKKLMVPLLTSYNENKDSWDPIKRANCNISTLYLINSLFFMHMNLNGSDIASSGIKDELERIKACLKELRETEVKLNLIERPKRTQVNVQAAKRFVNNAIWEPSNSINKK